MRQQQEMKLGHVLSMKLSMTRESNYYLIILRYNIYQQISMLHPNAGYHRKVDHLPYRNEFNTRLNNIQIKHNQINELLGHVKMRNRPVEGTQTTSIFYQNAEGCENGSRRYPNWGNNKSQTKNNNRSTNQCQNQNSNQKKNKKMRALHEREQQNLFHDESKDRYNLEQVNYDRSCVQRELSHIHRTSDLAAEHERIRVQTVSMAFQRGQASQMQEARERSVSKLGDRKGHNRYRNKSPLLIRPVSKYIRADNKLREKEKRVSHEKSFKSRSLSRSASPIARITTSSQVNEYLNRISPQLSKGEQTEEKLTVRGLDASKFNSKNIPEERPSLEESNLIELPLIVTPKSNGCAGEFEIQVYPCDLNESNVLPYLADKFAQMVRIDIEVESLRDQYQEHSCREKRKKLIKALWDRGWMIGEEEAESYLGVSSAPGNKSEQQIEQIIEAFVNKFLEGQYFWDKKLSKLLTQNQIRNTKFIAAKLDLEKRGCLKIEDFTVFMNLYASSGVFKNKNIKPLFHRFTREENDRSRVEYKTFLKKICVD